MNELLTTGQVARLMGASRQHVVDLCSTGRLPYVTIGTHRRLSRSDVEALLHRSPVLTRDQLRSLWLHRAVAGKVALDPRRALDKARRNLTLMRDAHPRGQVAAELDAWQALLDGPLERLLDVLVSKSPRAVELRQNTPFSGVLTATERSRALGAFRQVSRAA